ncbi:hypothetical protein D3C73_1205630 [compost metagenome]
MCSGRDGSERLAAGTGEAGMDQERAAGENRQTGAGGCRSSRSGHGHSQAFLGRSYDQYKYERGFRRDLLYD